MIKKIKNGEWMARFYSYGKDIRKRGFKTKAEAQEGEEKRRKELEGIPYNTNNLQQMQEMYVAKRILTIKQTTIEQDTRIFFKYILPFFTYVSDITTHKILLWKSNLIKQNLSERYINQIIKCMKQLLIFASKQCPIQSGVLDELGAVKLHQVKKDMQIWSVDEFNKFIDTFEKDNGYHLLFTTLFWSGLRISELRALTPNDIVGKDIVVNKRLEAKSKTAKGISTLKTQSSYRRVPMPDYIINQLKEIKTPYLFPTSETQIRRILDKHIALAKVKHIRIHDFRHSHASFLLRNGTSLKLVSERLGHSSTSTTLDFYWNLLSNEQEQILDLIEKEKN